MYLDWSGEVKMRLKPKEIHDMIFNKEAGEWM